MSVTQSHNRQASTVSGNEGSVKFTRIKDGVLVETFGRNGGRRGEAILLPFDDLVEALNQRLTYESTLRPEYRFETKFKQEAKEAT